MYPQADGTVLETGTMTNPDTGGAMNYEELWQDLDASAVGEEKERACFVLRMEEPLKQARGMVVRIGEWIQGIARMGPQMTVVRWQYSGMEVRSHRRSLTVLLKLSRLSGREYWQLDLLLYHVMRFSW